MENRKVPTNPNEALAFLKQSEGELTPEEKQLIINHTIETIQAGLIKALVESSDGQSQAFKKIRTLKSLINNRKNDTRSLQALNDLEVYLQVSSKITNPTPGEYRLLKYLLDSTNKENIEDILKFNFKNGSSVEEFKPNIRVKLYLNILETSKDLNQFIYLTLELIATLSQLDSFVLDKQKRLALAKIINDAVKIPQDNIDANAYKKELKRLIQIEAISQEINEKLQIINDLLKVYLKNKSLALKGESSDLNTICAELLQTKKDIEKIINSTKDDDQLVVAYAALSIIAYSIENNTSQAIKYFQKYSLAKANSMLGAISKDKEFVITLFAHIDYSYALSLRKQNKFKESYLLLQGLHDANSINMIDPVSSVLANFYLYDNYSLGAKKIAESMTSSSYKASIMLRATLLELEALVKADPKSKDIAMLKREIITLGKKISYKESSVELSLGIFYFRYENKLELGFETLLVAFNKACNTLNLSKKANQQISFTEILESYHTIAHIEKLIDQDLKIKQLFQEKNIQLTDEMFKEAKNYVRKTEYKKLDLPLIEGDKELIASFKRDAQLKAPVKRASKKKASKVATPEKIDVQEAQALKPVMDVKVTQNGPDLLEEPKLLEVPENLPALPEINNSTPTKKQKNKKTKTKLLPDKQVNQDEQNALPEIQPIALGADQSKPSLNQPLHEETKTTTYTYELLEKVNIDAYLDPVVSDLIEHLKKNIVLSSPYHISWWGIRNAVRDVLGKLQKKQPETETQNESSDILDDIDLFSNASYLETNLALNKNPLYACEPTQGKFKINTIYLEGKKERLVKVDLCSYRSLNEANPDEISNSDEHGVMGDFYCNAFRCNILDNNKVEGLVGPETTAKKDLEDQLIRVIGDDIDKRVQENPMLILRGLRFAVVYGFKFEGKTGKAFKTHKNRVIPKIHPEKGLLTHHLSKGLFNGHGEAYFKRLNGKPYHLIDEIFPALKDTLLDGQSGYRFATVLLNQIDKHIKVNKITLEQEKKIATIFYSALVWLQFLNFLKQKNNLTSKEIHVTFKSLMYDNINVFLDKPIQKMLLKKSDAAIDAMQGITNYKERCIATLTECLKSFENEIAMVLLGKDVAVQHTDTAKNVEKEVEQIESTVDVQQFYYAQPYYNMPPQYYYLNSQPYYPSQPHPGCVQMYPQEYSGHVQMYAQPYPGYFPRYPQQPYPGYAERNHQQESSSKEGKQNTMPSYSRNPHLLHRQAPSSQQSTKKSHHDDVRDFSSKKLQQ